MVRISNPFAAMLLVALASPLVQAAQPSTQGAPTTTKSMQEQITGLESKIHALEAQSQTQPDDGAAVHKILEDADRHSELLPSSSFTSGYDPNIGFVLQGDDGNFSLHPGLLMQFRNATNNRNQITPGHGGPTGKQAGDDTQNGFELTRLRFTLDGNVFSPLITYYIQEAQDAGAGSTGLLDAYVMYRVSTQSPLALKAGQFKDPIWHEQNLLPSRQMAVDRSMVNMLIGGGQTDRVQGAALVFDQERSRGVVAVHDGYNGTNMPFNGPSGEGNVVGAGAGATPTNWGASARGEYLLIGDREPDSNPFYEYDQFSALGAKQNILVTGGGLDYSESGSNKVVFHTVDAQMDTTNGWSFYAAYLGAYRNFHANKGIQPGSYYDSGFVVQAGYLVNANIEPFARFDYTHLAGKAQPGIVQDNIDEITLGLNYYLVGQHAKISVDATWLPNGSPTSVTNLDVLQNNGHNEYLLRAQFQLAL